MLVLDVNYVNMNSLLCSHQMKQGLVYWLPYKLLVKLAKREMQFLLV